MVHNGGTGRNGDRNRARRGLPFRPFGTISFAIRLRSFNLFITEVGNRGRKYLRALSAYLQAVLLRSIHMQIRHRTVERRSHERRKYFELMELDDPNESID